MDDFLLDIQIAISNARYIWNKIPRENSIKREKALCEIRELEDMLVEETKKQEKIKCK